MMEAASTQWMPLENVEPAAKYNGIKHLQSAISNGSVIEACRLITQLTQQRAEIQLIPRFPPAKPEISVTICLEDKNMSHGQLVLKLSPSMSVSELKDKMLYERGIPPELQCWVVRNEIMKDDRKSLSSCGVERDGDTIHLYVLSGLLGSSTNNIRKKYEHIRQGPAVTSGSSGLSRPPAPPLQSAPMSFPPTRTSTFREAVVTTPIFTPPPAPPVSSGATSMPPKPPAEGWSCPACTYINVPSRPGCEICSETRPESYKMPDTFEIPAQEQARLAREAEDQAKIRHNPLHEDVRQEIIAALRDPIPARPRPTPAASGAGSGFNSRYMGVASAIPPTAEMSWECPRCTFINAAVRPGCEICTGSRPDVGIEIGAPIDDEEHQQLQMFKMALANYVLDNEANKEEAAANPPGESQA